MSQREKSKLYYGTIHSADIGKIKKLFSVDDNDGKKIAAAYERFPQHLVFARPGYRTDGWTLFGWTFEQDDSVKEAIWLLEQAHGAYENRREEFDKDWAAGEYSPWGCHVFPDELITVEGEMSRKHAEGSENK